MQTDSQYLVNVANRYLKTWRDNGYIKKDGKPVKHTEDIKKLADMLSLINVRIFLSYFIYYTLVGSHSTSS